MSEIFDSFQGLNDLRTIEHPEILSVLRPLLYGGMAKTDIKGNTNLGDEFKGFYSGGEISSSTIQGFSLSKYETSSPRGLLEKIINDVFPDTLHQYDKIDDIDESRLYNMIALKTDSPIYDLPKSFGDFNLCSIVFRQNNFFISAVRCGKNAWRLFKYSQIEDANSLLILSDIAIELGIIPHIAFYNKKFPQIKQEKALTDHFNKIKKQKYQETENRKIDSIKKYEPNKLNLAKRSSMKLPEPNTDPLQINKPTKESDHKDFHGPNPFKKEAANPLVSNVQKPPDIIGPDSAIKSAPIINTPSSLIGENPIENTNDKLLARKDPPDLPNINNFTSQKDLPILHSQSVPWQSARSIVELWTCIVCGTSNDKDIKICTSCTSKKEDGNTREDYFPSRQPLDTEGKNSTNLQASNTELDTYNSSLPNEIEGNSSLSNDWKCRNCGHFNEDFRFICDSCTKTDQDLFLKLNNIYQS